ncbi:hypothetical protein [Streptomyces luteocolor]|uniref:hypothetical protein n=1 Tax=Streptomyces luteocolor TaxID=285500 RepID=UPI000AF62B9E|nr:hypothetical protein [Streptomyces luteocolor]
MSQVMNFVLTGRDGLSRVLDRAGDSADRLGRRLLAASINGDAAMRRLSTQTTNRMAAMQRDTDAGSKALEQLKKTTLSLAPAAIPAAASLVPVAAGAGAVAVATMAMTAALVPQVAALGEASEAEKKYQDAVAKSGARSEAAITAQAEYAQAVAKLPPETRRAAAAVGVLKDEYQDWSDSLAGDTMAPFTKGVALVNTLLPKTQSLVKGTSAEADRFMTIVGGTMATPGLDSVNRKFTEFSTNTLSRVNDRLVSVLSTLNNGGGGQTGGQVREFMDWARAQGPTVGSILENVGTALVHVLQAGSEVGVGMLQAVDVLASIVAAVPPGAISVLLQLAVALRLVKLAAAGMAAASAGAAMFGGQLVAMRTGAAGASGAVGRLTGAFGGLSRAAKLNIAAVGVGLMVMAISKLGNLGRQAPPDVDKLTTSLGKLGQSGKASGEAARLFGSDLDGLYGAVRNITDPAVIDNIQNAAVKIFSLGMADSTPSKEAKERLDALDDSLTSLVQGGKADIAAAALKRLTAEYGKGGKDVSKLTNQLDGYKQALANKKFEEQLAAESMGLFGAQAQAVQAKLDAQKRSTDGLRQSIIALNEVNRAALDGRAGMEAAIDNAAKLTRSHARALKMVNGELDVGTPKAREAQAALTDLARKTEGNVTAARESGRSWSYAKGQYDRGRTALIRSAQAMGLTRAQAERLASQILRTPNKTAYLRGNLQDLQAKLAAAREKLRSVPDSRKAQVRAEIAQLLEKIRMAKGAIASVKGKTVGIGVYTTNYYRTVDQGGSVPKYLRRPKGATGGLYTGSDFAHRGKGYAGGGLVEGPGTGTSDSVFAPWLSAKEFVVNAAQTAKHLPLLRAINEGRFQLGSLSSGGTGGVGAAVGQGLAGGIGAAHGLVEKASRAMAAAVLTGMKDELQIASPSKRTRALAKDVGKGLINGLTGSRDKIKSTSKDLAKDIWSAFSGRKDNRLVAYVNRHTKTLLTLAGKRDSIAAAMKRAKEFAENTRVGAKKSASLGGMFEGDEKITASGINSKLQQRLARMRTFSSYIKTLAKRGLNKTMLREILEMGPEEGYAYASALAGSSSKLLKEINSTQYKINDQAESLGRSGADALYDSGKNAGKGFLKGLQSQQSAIEKQMLKIAKGMDKAIRRALGIKSPSTVMAQVGRYSTEGLAAGLTDRMPVLDQALAAVSGRVAATRPVVGRPAVATAGGAQVVHLSVEVKGVHDPLSVAKELQRMLLNLKRTHGVNVSLGVA